MKRYAVIDKQGCNFMQDTWDKPMTLNQLRARFWGLEDCRTEDYKDFTADYIKEAWAGFYDSLNGSGSVLEVRLLKDITLPKSYGKEEDKPYNTIDIVLDEHKKYSVEQTYGLCNVPEIKLKVK